MNLVYRILWFEDDSELVEEELGPELADYLDRYGFKLDYNHRTDGTNLEELIYGKKYDLILTDLNFEEGKKTGEIIIDEIRKNKILTEVLLYSSNSTAIETIKKNSGSIERISFAVGREALPIKIKQIIDLTIQKFQDVNAIRGFVMAETSELDVQMIDVINRFFLSDTYENSIRKKQELIDKTVKNRKDRVKAIEKIEIENIDKLINKLESYEKNIQIGRLIDHHHLEKGKNIFSEYKEILECYKKEVIDARNILAHAKEITENGQTKLIGNVENMRIIFDQNMCNNLRKQIRKHKENLDNIINSISHNIGEGSKSS